MLLKDGISESIAETGKSKGSNSDPNMTTPELKCQASVWSCSGIFFIKNQLPY